MWLRGAALLLLLLSSAAQELRIGVVEAEPARALQLAAALEAALGEGAALVAPVEPDEPLAAQAHVCRQAEEEAAAVVMGAGEGGRAAALGAAAAARAGLPLLLVQPAAAAAESEALALYPHEDVIAQACVELCEAKGWRAAALLHEGSARGAALLAPDGQRLQLLPRRLPPPHDDALLRNLLLVLKKSEVTNFIVWCSAECGVRVLDAAQRVGLLSARHSYVLATLELHTLSLAAYSHGGANVSALQLYDLGHAATVRALAAWREAYVRLLHDEAEAERVAEAPPVALLLAYDAAGLVAEVQRRLALPAMAGADCARGAGSFHADTLLNYLRSTEWSGAEGTDGAEGVEGMAWEADGARRDVRLRVVELQRGGRLAAAGAWAPRAGLSWTRQPRPAPPAPRNSMTNRTFTVLIAMSKPYVMRQESSERLSGNDRYEGFCIELIDRLAQLLHFNYTFVEQADGAYGSYNNATGQWSGMMRRLMDDPEIDFAITDLTITAERERAVDFTTTFMNLGISILFRRPKPPEPELFAFLLPFSNGVWLCLGLAYVGTSLLLYVVGRLCPEEWQNPYPCVEEPAALENQFTLANALWFNLGAVLLQGSEIAPVAYGTRAVAGVWWLFALVITSSYTANLATLLAKKTSSELIHDVNELANNEFGITYGAKSGGSTYTFFEHSQNQLYQNMFTKMSEHTMPDSNDLGITKVMTENYAFLMESTSIEYTIERNCAVTMVGEPLDSKGYGIAMKKNSPYRHEMNLALLNLQEAGILREMKHRWWNEKHGGGACKEVEGRESTKLSMASFLGLFLVLVVGCALGVLLSCCDLALAARRPRPPPAPPAPYHRRFWEELRFVFNFERSVKPLQGPLIESMSTSPAQSASTRGEPNDDGDDGEARLRSMSLRSAGGGGGGGAGGGGGGGVGGGGTGAGRWSRRRSSMHAASARLARHASRRERRSSSPAEATPPQRNGH